MRCRAAQREAGSSRRGTAKLRVLWQVQACSAFPSAAGAGSPMGLSEPPLLPGLLGHSLALGWLKEDSLSWES